MPERKPFFVGTFWALRVSDSHAVVCLRQFHVEVVFGDDFCLYDGSLVFKVQKSLLNSSPFSCR